jgi:hypothetical protein
MLLLMIERFSSELLDVDKGFLSFWVTVDVENVSFACSELLMLGGQKHFFAEIRNYLCGIESKRLVYCAHPRLMRPEIGRMVHASAVCSSRLNFSSWRRAVDRLCWYDVVSELNFDSIDCMKLEDVTRCRIRIAPISGCTGWNCNLGIPVVAVANLQSVWPPTCQKLFKDSRRRLARRWTTPIAGFLLRLHGQNSNIGKG